MQSNDNLYFNTETVLTDLRFFWVGRGGHANTNFGNDRVRRIISDWSLDYLELPRPQRGKIAKRLLSKELQDVKFVIPRDSLLSNLEHDDQHCGKQPRRVGKTRRKSILCRHVSLDQIRSYPEDVCIDVGYLWSLDILNHILREEADFARRVLEDLAISGQEEVPGLEATDSENSISSQEDSSVMSEQHVADHRKRDLEEACATGTEAQLNKEREANTRQDEMNLPLHDDGVEAIDELFSYLNDTLVSFDQSAIGLRKRRRVAECTPVPLNMIPKDTSVHMNTLVHRVGSYP